MTDKELRRLKRPQLLEILFYLQKELDRLKQENEELKQRLDADREIPESIAKQLEQIVRKAVDGYPVQESSEKKNTGDNGEIAVSGQNGEQNGADK